MAAPPLPSTHTNATPRPPSSDDNTSDKTRDGPPGLGVALLIVVTALGVGAYAVFAASGAPDFSIARTPAAQTVSQGQTATYTVTVKRMNGFTDRWP